MDVAEQALTALAMLSRRHGKAILQAVSITLQYISNSRNYLSLEVPNHNLLHENLTDWWLCDLHPLVCSIFPKKQQKRKTKTKKPQSTE